MPGDGEPDEARPEPGQQRPGHRNAGARSCFPFFVESLIIAFVGGLVGCIAVLPVNGITTGTMNWQTFSHLAFVFSITPDLLAMGMVFALIMGAVGGLPRHPRRPRQRGPHLARAVGLSSRGTSVGRVAVRRAGVVTLFDFGDWTSEVASSHNPDGTVSFLTTACQ